jgi:hypothetical protein
MTTVAELIETLSKLPQDDEVQFIAQYNIVMNHTPKPEVAPETTTEAVEEPQVADEQDE